MLWHENAFRINVSMRGKPPVNGGFHTQRSVIRLWCFLCFRPELAVEQTAQSPVIWDAMTLMWCHYNDADLLLSTAVTGHHTVRRSVRQSGLVRSHYNDVIVGAIASLITCLMIVYSTVYSDADQRKHQSSASLACVRGIHQGPVNSPHRWPVTRKIFPFWWRHHGSTKLGRLPD